MHKPYRLLFMSDKKKREKMQTRIQTHNKCEQYRLLFISAEKKKKLEEEERENAKCANTDPNHTNIWYAFRSVYFT